MMTRPASRPIPSPLLLALLLCATASQAAPPSPTQPRRLEPMEAPAPLPSSAPPVFSLPVLPEAPLPQAPVEGSYPVNAFRILGVTAFSPATIAALVAPYRQRPLTPELLDELRYRLTRLYIEAGYLNSGAMLLTPRPIDGVITYQVVEGVLGEVRVQGQGDLDAAYLVERIRLDAAPPLDTRRLQERIRLLLQDPLFERLDATLVPTDTLGMARLDLQVTRARPWRLLLGLDNHHALSSGEWRTTLSGSAYNPGGGGDRLDLDLAASAGASEGSLGYNRPLTASGLRLALSQSLSHTRVTQAPLDDLAIESDARATRIGLTQGLIERLDQHLELGLAVRHEQARNSLLGEPFSFGPGEEAGEVRLTSLELNTAYTRRGLSDAYGLESNLLFGLPWFDATEQPMPTPDSRYRAWIGRAQYAQRLTPNRQWVARLDLQWSSERLLAPARFAVGGAGSVRGYAENSQSGDEGFSATLELRQALLLATQRPTLALFYDLGRTRNRGEAPRPLLRSVGLGLNWQRGDLGLDLVWAHALDPRVEEEGAQGHGVHLRLEYRL